MSFNASELAASVETLKSLPSAYLNIRRVIENPVSSTNDLARAISVDPALTARLLRLVNSPLYGFTSKIETVSRALVILGMQQVHDLALATTVAGMFKSARPQRLDLDNFWRESVYCALAARAIAKLCNVLDSERLFVAGLLHRIGHMVMDEVIADAADEARKLAVAEQVPLAEAESRALGCNYAKVGGALARRWAMPESLCSAIEHHVDPRLAAPPAFVESIVHIASQVTRAVIDNASADNWADRVVPMSWEATGLTPACFSPVKVQADSQYADTAAMLSNGATRAA